MCAWGRSKIQWLQTFARNPARRPPRCVCVWHIATLARKNVLAQPGTQNHQICPKKIAKWVTINPAGVVTGPGRHVVAGPGRQDRPGPDRAKAGHNRQESCHIMAQGALGPPNPFFGPWSNPENHKIFNFLVFEFKILGSGGRWRALLWKFLYNRVLGTGLMGSQVASAPQVARSGVEIWGKVIFGRNT